MNQPTGGSWVHRHTAAAGDAARQRHDLLSCPQPALVARVQIARIAIF